MVCKPESRPPLEPVTSWRSPTSRALKRSKSTLCSPLLCSTNLSSNPSAPILSCFLTVFDAHITSRLLSFGSLTNPLQATRRDTPILSWLMGIPYLMLLCLNNGTLLPPKGQRNESMLKMTTGHVLVVPLSSETIDVPDFPHFGAAAHTALDRILSHTSRLKLPVLSSRFFQQVVLFGGCLSDF